VAEGWFKNGSLNYAVFYVVIENVMEVLRFSYAKRNIPDII